MARTPIILKPFQPAECNHPGQPFVGRQAERHVKWHPVLDQVETVNQIGVPAQFPCAALPMLGAAPTDKAEATASIPMFPRRPTRASS